MMDVHPRRADIAPSQQLTLDPVFQRCPNSNSVWLTDCGGNPANNTTADTHPANPAATCLWSYSPSRRNLTSLQTNATTPVESCVVDIRCNQGEILGPNSEQMQAMKFKGVPLRTPISHLSVFSGIHTVLDHVD